jgi:cytochrome c-type biogenesis protein CcmE
MTLARPVLPPMPAHGRRWGVLLGVAIVIAVIAYIAFSSVGNALVYYVTPTELLARGGSAVGQTVRLGGLVKVGSVQASATHIRFVLTDGTHDLPVESSALPTRSFREGIGAVVEGELGADGVFHANQVIVKHDENYVAPTAGALPTQAFIPGT